MKMRTCISFCILRHWLYMYIMFFNVLFLLSWRPYSNTWGKQCDVVVLCVAWCGQFRSREQSLARTANRLYLATLYQWPRDGSSNPTAARQPGSHSQWSRRQSRLWWLCLCGCLRNFTNMRLIPISLFLLFVHFNILWCLPPLLLMFIFHLALAFFPSFTTYSYFTYKTNSLPWNTPYDIPLY